MNRSKTRVEGLVSNLICQVESQTAALIKKWWPRAAVREAGVQPGVRVRYVRAVALYQGDQAMFAWHNKTLKPQLKGNICREGLYVSQREKESERHAQKEMMD